MSARPVVVWRGTPDEAQELVRAVAHSCACLFDWERRVEVCTVHTMLLEQRVLDGLIASRRRRGELVAQEQAA